MTQKPTSIYDTGLDRNAANYVPLTPLTFIERTAYIYPDRVALIHGERRFTWLQTYGRCRRLASALKARGVGYGDTVSVILNNTPEMYECHFGVPAIGAVLNTINTRLDAESIAFILNHAEAKVLITDREYAHAVKQAIATAGREMLVIDVDDPEYRGPGDRLGSIDYEALLAEGSPDFIFEQPSDEWNAISLNYTSGTTGNPKGWSPSPRRLPQCDVEHRELGHGAAFDLPVDATDVPLQRLVLRVDHGRQRGYQRMPASRDPRLIFDAIRNHEVTHYCGAPIVHSMLANAPAEWRKGINHKVSVSLPQPLRLP